jgi:hypothetical protein
MESAMVQSKMKPIDHIIELISWDAYFPSGIWKWLIRQYTNIAKLLFGVLNWMCHLTLPELLIILLALGYSCKIKSKWYIIGVGQVEKTFEEFIVI